MSKARTRGRLSLRGACSLFHILLSPEEIDCRHLLVPPHRYKTKQVKVLLQLVFVRHGGPKAYWAATDTLRSAALKRQATIEMRSELNQGGDEAFA